MTLDNTHLGAKLVDGTVVEQEVNATVRGCLLDSRRVAAAIVGLLSERRPLPRAVE